MAKKKYTDKERFASNRYSSLKQKIRYNIGEKWSRDGFIKWYLAKEKKCCYCGFNENEIVEFFDIVKSKRKTRGKTFEIERKKDEEYSEKNCELCCYWCNMSKSDVFTHDEFIGIGEAMRKVKLKILEKYRDKIRLPFEKTFFDINLLIDYFKSNKIQYIIIGGQHVKLSRHTKPKSLDYWLRENVARNKDTCQISKKFIEGLCNTGRFKVKENCICPGTGQRCRAIVLQKTEKKR